MADDAIIRLDDPEGTASKLMKFPKYTTVGELFQKAVQIFGKRDIAGLFLYCPVQQDVPNGLVLDPTLQIGAFARSVDHRQPTVVQLLRGGIAGVPRTGGQQPMQPQQQQMMMMQQQQQQQQFQGGGGGAAQPPTGPVDSSSTIQKKPKILQFLSSFFTARPSQEELIKKKVLQTEIHPESSLPLRYDIVAKCIQFIERIGMQQEGIYRISGNQTEVRELSRQFGSMDFQPPDHTPLHTVSGALKLYLRELNPPLIPFEFYSSFMNSQNNLGRPDDSVPILQNLISQLPLLNHDILELLCRHFNRITKYEAQNKMSAQNIAIVMGPTLLRPRVEAPDPMTIVTDNERKCNIMRVCVDHVEIVFSGPNSSVPMQSLQQQPQQQQQAPPRPNPNRGGAPGAGGVNLMGEMASRLKQMPARGPPPPGGMTMSMKPPPSAGLGGAPPPNPNPMAMSMRMPPSQPQFQSQPPPQFQSQPPPQQFQPPQQQAGPAGLAPPPGRQMPGGGTARPMVLPAMPPGGNLRKGHSESDVLANRKTAHTLATSQYGKLPLNASMNATLDDNTMNVPQIPRSTTPDSMAGPPPAEQYGSLSAIMNTKEQPPAPTPSIKMGAAVLPPMQGGRPQLKATTTTTNAPAPIPAPSSTQKPIQQPPAQIQRPQATTTPIKPGMETYGKLSSVKAPPPMMSAAPTTLQPAAPAVDYTQMVPDQQMDYQELMAMYGSPTDPQMMSEMMASEYGQQTQEQSSYENQQDYSQQQDQYSQQQPQKTPQDIINEIMMSSPDTLPYSLAELKQVYIENGNSWGDSFPKEPLIQLVLKLANSLRRQ